MKAAILLLPTPGDGYSEGNTDAEGIEASSEADPWSEEVFALAVADRVSQPGGEASQKTDANGKGSVPDPAQRGNRAKRAHEWNLRFEGPLLRAAAREAQPATEVR
jgi:hypothetical protein